MKNILLLLCLFGSVASAHAEDFICIGSGLTIDGKGTVAIVRQEVAYDFTETILDIQGQEFHLYAGFHPWIERREDTVLKLDLESRYRIPILKILSKGKEGKTHLEVVVTVIREEYGKPLYLSFSSGDAEWDDAKKISGLIRTLEYRYEDCSDLAEDTEEPEQSH